MFLLDERWRNLALVAAILIVGSIAVLFLFNLPIRPVAIHGSRENLCPVCLHRETVRRFVEDADIQALKDWAARCSRTYRACSSLPDVATSHEKQLMLFETTVPADDFLAACHSSTASGVTLHALGATAQDGSAPLILPELFDVRIQSRKRTAIMEHLPTGVLHWNGDHLTQNVMQVLSESVNPTNWRASANLLSREGRYEWLDQLAPFLERLAITKTKASESFWNYLTCDVLMLASRDPKFVVTASERVNDLLRSDVDNTARDGLNVIRETLDYCAGSP